MPKKCKMVPINAFHEALPVKNGILQFYRPAEEGNTRPHKGSGHRPSPHKGVYWSTTARRWRAAFRRGNEYVNLGFFDDPEEAQEVYNDYVEARNKKLGN